MAPAPPPRAGTNAEPAPATSATSASKGGGDDPQLAKWWTAISRLVGVQLGCGLLMQLSYVAFPAYNFALALWCLVCCTPKWIAKNPHLVPLHVLGIAFSVVTDVIWMSLWVSGRVFYDQFCAQNSVTIVSCGGATEHYPGCQTNRFALFALLVDDFAKVATAAALYRVHSVANPSHSSSGDSHLRHHHHHRAHSDATPGSVPPSVPRLNYQSAVRQVPTTDNFYDPRSEA